MLPPIPILFLWIPTVIFLFRWLPFSRAFVISYIGAFQFLPQSALILPLLIPFSKMPVTTYGVLIAILLFDLRPIKSFRLTWLDAPVLIYCFCPLISYYLNDLSLVDGAKNVFAQFVTWGGPYFLGRIFIGSSEGLRKLAVGMFVGGLLYMPFCAIENVMGPLLHQKVYGVGALGDWSQSKRYGGWRPVVFMEHGLTVGVWMMAAALIGIWLWKTKTIKKLVNLPVGWLAFCLTLSFIAVLSTGAWVLMILGLLILFSSRWFRTAFLLIVLISYLYLYLSNAMLGNVSREQITTGLAQVFEEGRVSSVDFRLKNEEILAEKARQRFWFGWAGKGRNRVVNEYDGRDAAITDSYWILVFGVNGAVGIYSWLGMLLFPVIGFIICFPAKYWSHPKVAPAAALSVVIVLYVFDCTLNAMLNPIFTIAAGGLSGVMAQQLRNRVDGVNLSVASFYLNNQSKTYQQQPETQVFARDEGKLQG